MRIHNIPRGLSSETAVAEQIELGAGTTDRRVGHVGPVASGNVSHVSEKEWFQNLETQETDPRLARSDYHDYPTNVMMDKTVKKNIEEVELCEGLIIAASMYPEGAGLTIQNSDTEIFYVFIPSINFVVQGAAVKIIDRVISTIYDGNNIFGSNPLVQDEEHELLIIELEEESDLEENNEAGTEE